MDVIKVREVSGEEEKSSQQIEAELLEKHEEQFEDAQKPQDTVTVKLADAEDNTPEETVVAEAPEEATEDAPSAQEEKELEETDVLSFIQERYGKEITSMKELFEQPAEPEPLPDEVTAFLEFKKETGRSIEDFISLNKDFDSMDPDKLLAEYWSATKPHLDDDDIAFELENNFSHDEDYDDQKEIRKTKIAKKQELVKAKEYFNQQKKQYGVPLESSGSLVSEGERESYDAYKKYSQESQDLQQQNVKKQEFFLDKTNKLFSEDFKGFDFTIGEKQFTYKPGTAEHLKKTQSDVTNFINTHVNEEGYLKDATAYHRSLSAAMNPEAFAKFFYEQGKADAVGDITRESKNVDMPVRRSPESVSKGGLQVRAVPTTHGSGLKIRSRKKS